MASLSLTISMWDIQNATRARWTAQILKLSQVFPQLISLKPAVRLL
jgi:hypothetical protein